MSSSDPARVEAMQEQWERFGRDDPMFYIALLPKGTSPEEFFAQGADLAERTLDWVGPDLGRGRMLEVGCGLGRMVRQFASAFERVDGIDISTEMIAGAKELDPPDNVHFESGSGVDLSPYEDSAFDFVFSYEVFQHIPDENVIAYYLSEVARVLKPGGRSALHFDTRPITLPARAYFALPEFMRRRSHRSFIRRYRREPEWLRSSAEAAGLRVLDERGVATTDFWLLLAAE